MLRESMRASGREVDVRGVTQGFDDDVDIAHAGALVEFAEAVVLRDAARAAAARAGLRIALGEAGLVGLGDPVGGAVEQPAVAPLVSLTTALNRVAAGSSASSEYIIAPASPLQCW